MRYLFLTLILIPSFLISKDYPDLTGYIGLDYNIHNASIESLSGKENCCDEFTGDNSFEPSFGIGTNIGIGQLFGLDLFYSPFLKYNGISGNFEETRFRGFIIRDNQADSLITNFNLDPNVKLLSIENQFLLSVNSFQIGLGAIVALPIVSTYSENETIQSPEDITFSETDLDQINSFEGDIEGMSSLLFGLSANIKYDVYEFDNIIIRPEISGTYYLNSALENQDWNPYKISAGINIVYNFIEEEEPPKMMPMPDLPEPEAPVPPSISAETKLINLNDDSIIKNQLTVPVSITEYKESYSIKPIVFYDSASTDYKIYNLNSLFRKSRDVQSDLLKAVSTKLKNDSLDRVTLTAYNLDDESDEIPVQRINKVKEILIAEGLNENQIDSKVIKIEKDFRYPEVKNEYRTVEINLPLVETTYEIDEEVDVTSVEIMPEVSVNSSEEEYDLKTLVLYNGKIEKEFEGTNSFKIGQDEKNYLFNRRKFIVNFNTIAETRGVSYSGSKEFEVIPKIEKNVVVNKHQDNGKEYFQYILAYTDFDNATLKQIDNKVKNTVIKALKEGKKVELIASTDNLGSEEYNQKLASQRADNAGELFKNLEGNLEVKTSDDFLFSNSHPYGRMLNRAIVVRISE